MKDQELRHGLPGSLQQLHRVLAEFFRTDLFEPLLELVLVGRLGCQIHGLRLVQDILDGVEDVYFSKLTSHDVVRHKLVADIVDAYERYDARRASAETTERISGSRSRRTGNRAR